MNICLFSQEEFLKPLSLKDERAIHIIKILHKKEGETFSAGVINGQAGKALITKITDDSIEYTFTPETDGKKLFPLIMIIGFPRPIQLKRLLRDVAALGVKEVHLTGTELGEKSYMQSSMSDHDTAYQMLIDGTVQAAGTNVPDLYLHKTLKDCLSFIDEHKQENFSTVRLCLDNINPAGSLLSVLQKNSNEKSHNCYYAAIGSERGWTDKERSLLEQNGFFRCGMGNRVMRTETAATVSASVISAFNGWLE